MIIEILLGVIALLLAVMGIGLVKLQKTMSKQYNLGNIQESSSRIRKTFGDLGKKLHQYSPQDLIAIFARYKNVSDNLDKIVEQKYKKPFVQTLQDIEIIKQYTQAGLQILYKYAGKVPTEILVNKLQSVIGAISVLGEELTPYEGKVVGTGLKGAEKYKPKPQGQA